jgi:glutaredoxin
MREAKLIITILILTSLSSAVSVAAPSTSTPEGVGPLFGGQSFDANMSGVTTTNLSELPPIAEVYTATWCSNCVDVEHALENIENDTHLQQYHMHRAINEAQDPLGSIELDQRFHDRYGIYSPPMVVMNGSLMKVGSVTNYDSLESEYTEMTQSMDSFGLGNPMDGTSFFSWNSTSETTGVASWALELKEHSLDPNTTYTLSAYAWIVEHSANFEEGTNGLGDYPDVVRGIIELGEITIDSDPIMGSGSSEITLPAAYDGNDLSVHLIYQFNAPVEEPLDEEECLIPEGCEEEERVPAASLLASLCVVGAAALSRRD